MNVEIGAEAAQFPEKEYINGLPLQCTVIVLCTLNRSRHFYDNNVSVSIILLSLVCELSRHQVYCTTLWTDCFITHVRTTV
jgi:hypothetical protein